MKISLLILIISSMLAACQHQQANRPSNEIDTAAAVETKITETSACYQYRSGNDSILLHINVAGNTVKGDLIYAFSQKDNNTGTIEGQMKGDTLFADYTFRSEGKQSVREVVFLKKGDTWVEGYGEVREAADKMVFVKIGALNFDGKVSFKKVACRKEAHGCLVSFGYIWSGLRNNCLQPFAAGIRLNAVENTGVAAESAFIVFSANQQQAELFLPGKAALVLARKGPEGKHYWENGDWKLYPWKGYILKQADKTVYAGQ